jgi:hypothetical protein
MNGKDNLICSRKFRYQALPAVVCKADSWETRMVKVASHTPNILALCDLTRTELFPAGHFRVLDNTGSDYGERRYNRTPNQAKPDWK